MNGSAAESTPQLIAYRALDLTSQGSACFGSFSRREQRPGAPSEGDPVTTVEIESILATEELTALLEEGKTREVLSGFRSRNNKPFRARLVLNEEGKVEFDFPVRTQPKAEQEAEPAAAK